MPQATNVRIKIKDVRHFFLFTRNSLHCIIKLEPDLYIRSLEEFYKRSIDAPYFKDRAIIETTLEDGTKREKQSIPPQGSPQKLDLPLEY